jgi:transcriptional regulator with XRE-family HTH domain
MPRQDRQLDTWIAVLRRLLRAGGFGVREIAREMGVSPATVKRWFAGQGLAADRLEELCGLAGVTLGELAELAAQPPRELARDLTLAQEQALTESPFLSFLFFSVMNGWPPSDFHHDFGVPMEAIEQQLRRLERLALIDRTPAGRVRSRIDRRILWRRGPMRKHFERHLKAQFVEMDYGDPAAIYTAETMKLSSAGLAQVEERIERFRQDLQHLADEDRRRSLLPRTWYALLVAARPLDMRALKDVSSASAPPR